MEVSQSNIRSENNAKIEHTVRCLEEELKSVAQNIPSWSIFRIPKRLRYVNPEAYTPHLISIGPLHHGNSSLSYMEKHKQNYLSAFLARTGNGDYSQALRPCVTKMIEIESQAVNCYATNVQPAEGLNLSKILITDACFIIELFLRYYIKNGPTIESLRTSSCGLFSHPPDNRAWLDNDPIFRSNWIISTLRRDLALLENQIPFFVLQDLLNTLASVAGCRNSFTDNLLAGLAFHFFEPALLSKHHLLDAELGAAVSWQGSFRKHLLNLLLNYHLPEGNGEGGNGGDSNGGVAAIIHNVTKLREVGIKLKKGKSDSGLFSFKFEDGVLEIPPLHIHEWSDSLFRNLMAFEHCFHAGGQCVAYYIILMDHLIDTKEDVKLLEGKGIITNELGGREYVVDFFKAICEQVVVKDFYFKGLCEKVDRYYKSRWRRYIHDLKRDYFATPWATISLSAAALILCLEVVQAVYGVLSYYSKK